MSTPHVLSPKTFFSRLPESEPPLDQARADLPPPRIVPTMRVRSPTASAAGLSRNEDAEACSFSFFSKQYPQVEALIGDSAKSRPVSQESERHENAVAKSAKIIAQLVQVHGERALTRLSSFQKGLVLIEAARQGYVDAVKCLLKSDTDIDVFDDSGENPLLAAARAGQLKALDRLLRAGCSVECFPAMEKDGNAIDYAIRHGQVHAAAMMALHHNIRLSQIAAGHPYRHCKGESPKRVGRSHGSGYADQ